MNSVLFHPSLLHIVTAGIERHVILHSPTRSSPCARDLALTPTSVRALPTRSPEDHSQLGLGTDDSDEDAETIALFDEYALCIMTGAVVGNLMMVCSILRTEGEGRGVFLSRSCDESGDEDEDISDEDVQWY